MLIAELYNFAMILVLCGRLSLLGDYLSTNHYLATSH